MKRILTFAAILCTALEPLSAGKPSKDTDTDQREVTLNKHQVAAVAVVLAEMRRRGERFQGWQMKLTDEGSTYSIAFLQDPIDMTSTGGDGMQWFVRKRDLKIIRGPIFYR